MAVRLLRPLTCRLCERNFVSFDRLQVHKHRHTAIKYGRWQSKFVSTLSQGLSGNIPQKGFFQNMRTHIKRPYQCEYCQNRFFQSGDLKMHIQIHRKEKPYQCTYCQKRFSQNEHLKMHIQTHTEEKPFQCTYCQKRFTKKCALKIHIRIHTKEKPFQCDYCQKRFNENSNLKRHIRTHTIPRRSLFNVNTYMYCQLGPVKMLT